MTIKEAGKNYEVSMNYWYDEDSDLWGWSWTLNCGYQCWDSKYTYADPAECQRKSRILPQNMDRTDQVI